MDAAVAALIGAGVGAVVPVFDNVRRDRRDDRRATAQRDDTREARLFDHRRAAYAAFVQRARADLATRGELDEDGRFTSPPDDFLVPLYDLVNDVALYGTADGTRAAREVLDLMMEYSFGSGVHWNKVDEALDRFLVQARMDLGGSA